MDNQQDFEQELEQIQDPTPEAQPVPGQEPELEELDLESIIQEFRAPEEKPAHQEQTDTSEPEEPVPLSSDTVPIDLSQLPKSVYHGAEPVAEDEDAPPIPQPEEKAEPFSDQWEPEYEQPMGEYIPQQPLIYHPQNRFQELKKKLVAGPERLYYKLAEKGTGRLQALLFLSMLIALICVGSTVLYQINYVNDDRMKLLIFGQLLCMFLSALLGSYQLIEGLADLVRGRFSLNTLLIFSFILCCADGVMCLQQIRVPCCAAFTLQVVFSLFDTLHRRRTLLSQMDILRKATDLTSIRQATEMLDGKKVMIRDEGQVEDFMDTYHLPSLPEKIRSWYAIGALVAALGVGIIGMLLQDLSTGLHIAAVTLLAAVPASFFICLSRPADVLQKRFHKLGTLLCGWKGICTTKGKLAFSVNHQDLFPTGTVKMNGVKFFGNRDPDEVVAYGTALILADSNGLAPVFEQVLESRNCHHLTAQNVQLYNGGIGGDVRGEPVLVGTLAFLKEMGVEIPEGLRVSQAVCVAVDGILSGLFAISYEKNRRCASGLGTLCAYNDLTAVITDGDFLLTPGFLHTKFGINPKRIVFADAQLRSALAALEPDREGPAAVLCTENDLASLAYGLTGARALRKSSMLGLIVHMVGGVLGVGIMLTLTLLGATYLLTPMNVILYQLIWSIPGILLTEWPRLI